jgi:hypothetical protein
LGFSGEARKRFYVLAHGAAPVPLYRCGPFRLRPTEIEMLNCELALCYERNVAERLFNGSSTTGLWQRASIGWPAFLAGVLPVCVILWLD